MSAVRVWVGRGEGARAYRLGRGGHLESEGDDSRAVEGGRVQQGKVATVAKVS